jgi:hypothetical protein
MRLLRIYPPLHSEEIRNTKGNHILYGSMILCSLQFHVKALFNSAPKRTHTPFEGKDHAYHYT